MIRRTAHRSPRTREGRQRRSPQVAEARRYGADRDTEFARRQVAARRRFGRLVDFYRAHPCRMARVHLLTAAAVTLGRFCGLSEPFGTIGEELMPVDAAGRPRKPDWRAYRDACAAGRPMVVRDELWLTAHFEDMEHVRTQGLDAAFYREAEAHEDDPTWRLLRLHMEATLGARLVDGPALRGLIPYESAVAHGMRKALGRLMSDGRKLLARYTRETARAILVPERSTDPSLLTYRHTAWVLLRTSVSAWTSATVYRRGLRHRDRGRRAEDDAWALLAPVLGDRLHAVDPRIVRFYSNPSRHAVTASLELRTRSARLGSRLATLLVGQGLYEHDRDGIEARFRVFRRADGTMHFVRELYVEGALRVFDSDFVVRTVDGTPTLFEVFVDERIEVRMDVAPLPGGGLSIRGRHVYLRGVRLPRFGLQVDFRSRVVEHDGGGYHLTIDGYLLLQPRSRIGHRIARGWLRSPEVLGAIHYRIAPPDSSGRPLPSQLRAAPGAGLPPSIRRT